MWVFLKLLLLELNFHARYDMSMSSGTAARSAVQRLRQSICDVT